MDPTNANTALASAFVEELARCGMRSAVLSPGSRSTPLAVALWRQPEIEVTVIVDERSAAYFALGAAQASGTPVAVLCTSGTAAANFHPAVCEADLSAVPLIALSADRPPELRDIGAGQTIDQIKLYGSSVRWFCEVGTHSADDDGLLHYRSTACRAFAAARGEPRPGPVHLNLPWREPLAPIAVEGAVTATDELALRGRGQGPLTAVTPIDLEPSQFLLEEVAKHIDEALSGVIVAGRQLDPGLREPLVDLARVAGFPILAEPTSQIRCGPHDRSHVVTAYDLLLRDEKFGTRVVPDLVLRFGEMPTSKPLRAWLAASGADQIVVDPRGAWNDPARQAAAILRADPTDLAAGWAARLGEDREPPEAWIAAESAAREAIDAELDGLDTLTEPGLHSTLGDAHADGDLVYTASSMPIRDQEAFLGAVDADALFLCNRGANGLDGLVSSGDRGRGQRPGGRRRSSPATSASSTTSAPSPPCARSRPRSGSSSSTTTAAGSSTSSPRRRLSTRASSRPCSAPRAASPPPAPPSLFELPHHRLGSLEELPEALAAGTSLIEVRTDRRTNVELHRRLADRVSAAISTSR